MGAGDIKLMAALGALLGPKDILFAAAFTTIAGGVYAAILLAARNNRRLLERYGSMVRGLLYTGHLTYFRPDKENTTPLKYGVAIAAGGVAALVHRTLFQ